MMYKIALNSSMIFLKIIIILNRFKDKFNMIFIIISLIDYCFTTILLFMKPYSLFVFLYI